MENKLFNSEFVELVNNGEFVSLVNAAQDTNELLADLLTKYPKNSDNLRYAVEFILLTQGDKKQLDSKEYELLLKNIQSKSQGEKDRKIFFHRLANYKVASIILVLFAIGTLVFYNQFVQDPLRQFAEKNEGLENESMIVLSDGSKHILSDNELDIDYETKLGEILVQKKESLVATLENKTKDKEEILNQVIVPYGQRQRVVLSDGTSVDLNAGSRLVFPAVFLGKNRTVYLEGEGYFNVQKDSRHPFIVKTDFINVKVYGTVFDIAAYKDEEFASTVLVEGSVSVSEKGKILKNQSLFIKPGEACFYSIGNKRLDVKNIDVNSFTSWKDGIYNFNDVPLSYIVKRVMKYYNVRIDVEDTEILETGLTGKLRITGNIDEVVQYISKTLECRYEKDIDGKYTLYKLN